MLNVIVFKIWVNKNWSGRVSKVGYLRKVFDLMVNGLKWKWIVEMMRVKIRMIIMVFKGIFIVIVFNY